MDHRLGSRGVSAFVPCFGADLDIERLLIILGLLVSLLLIGNWVISGPGSIFTWLWKRNYTKLYMEKVVRDANIKFSISSRMAVLNVSNVL